MTTIQLARPAFWATLLALLLVMQNVHSASLPASSSSSSSSSDASDMFRAAHQWLSEGRSSSLTSTSQTPLRTTENLSMPDVVPADSLLDAAGSEYAYATFLSGIRDSYESESDNLFRVQYATAAMVWCESVRATYTDASTTSRKFDMVLLTLDADMSQVHQQRLRRCFDRILVVPAIGRAPRGTPDTPFWAAVRSKFAVFSLKEYRRIIAMDCDHVVVKNLDDYFFRWYYDVNARSTDGQSDIELAVTAAQSGADTPRMLYSPLHPDVPADSSFWSLQPSSEVMKQLFQLLEAGDFTTESGWNNYGPVSTPDPSTLFAPRVSLDRAPQLHATPEMYHAADLIHAWRGNTRVWKLETAWADFGMALYYFYLRTPELGGFVHPEDSQRSFIHYHSTNKPWMHTPESVRESVSLESSAGDVERANQWADAMQYWQQLAAQVEAADSAEYANHRRFSPQAFQAGLTPALRQSLRPRFTLAYPFPPVGSTYTVSPATATVATSGTVSLTFHDTSSCNTDCYTMPTVTLTGCTGTISPAVLTPMGTVVLTYTAPSTIPAGGQDVCTLSSSGFLDTFNPTSLTFTIVAGSSLSLVNGPFVTDSLSSLQVSSTITPTASVAVHLECTSSVTASVVTAIDFTIPSGQTVSETKTWTPPKANSDYELACKLSVTASADTSFTSMGPATFTRTVVRPIALPVTVFIYGNKV